MIVPMLLAVSATIVGGFLGWCWANLIDRTFDRPPGTEDAK